MKVFKTDIVSQLIGVRTALDEAIGDTDVTHLDDETLRDRYPVQWAAERISEVIEELARGDSK